MTTLIRRVRDALQTINVGSLTGDLLDLGAEITPFEMLGVRLTETPRPVIRITVDGGITKANLTESDPDSTVSASAIMSRISNNVRSTCDMMIFAGSAPASTAIVIASIGALVARPG